MKVVLARMVEDQWITQAQADAAWQEKSATAWLAGGVRRERRREDRAKLVDRTAKELKAVTTIRAPHFMGQVEGELVRRFGREKVYGSGGLRVYTTLDPKLQNAVETASREATGLPPGATLGATILDPYTGEVLGMIGQKLVGQRAPRRVEQRRTGTASDRFHHQAAAVYHRAQHRPDPGSPRGRQTRVLSVHRL